MDKQAKIYIAGHTGMVGSAILRKYQGEGYTNLITKTKSELDLLNQAAAADFFKKINPYYVIVAAARVGGISANLTYPAEFLYENLQIQNNIIWQAHLAGVKKLVFLGSSCVYPRECQQPMKEEYLLTGKVEPTNEGYALAKITGLKLCRYLNDQYKKNFISCLPTNIYGHGDHFESEDAHVIPSLMSRIHKAKTENSPEVVVWGSGESFREFLYVDDLADAVYWLMNNYNDPEFINVGTGQDISIKELAELIKKVVGFKGNLVFDTSKPDGMPRKLLDISKLKNFGWVAQTSFADGLQQTYDWYQNKFVKP
ncbi:MAG: GDP-L-fucose synthase [Patescibacteria group bacterium]